MSIKILCLGDSVTYGEELPDPITQSWPALMAKENNWDVVNMGERGASNDRTIRLLYEEIDKKYDLIVISWTIWLRFEVYNRITQAPVSLAPRTYVSRGALWAKEYYMNWCDDSFAYKKMLTQIIQLQSYLKSIDQKYIFSMAINTYPNNDPTNYNSLLSKIDTSRFINWPETLISMTNDLPRGPNFHPLKDGHKRLAKIISDAIYATYPSLKTE